MSKTPWQRCATCGLYAITMIQCPACEQDNCVPHAAAHMEDHVSKARLFLDANKAVLRNRAEAQA